MSATSTSIQHCIDYLAGTKRENEIKSVINGMEETKRSLFNDDMTVCNKQSKIIYN